MWSALSSIGCAFYSYYLIIPNIGSRKHPHMIVYTMWIKLLDCSFHRFLCRLEKFNKPAGHSRAISIPFTSVFIITMKLWLMLMHALFSWGGYAMFGDLAQQAWPGGCILPWNLFVTVKLNGKGFWNSIIANWLEILWQGMLGFLVRTGLLVGQERIGLNTKRKFCDCARTIDEEKLPRCHFLQRWI